MSMLCKHQCLTLSLQMTEEKIFRDDQHVVEFSRNCIVTCLLNKSGHSCYHTYLLAITSEYSQCTFFHRNSLIHALQQFQYLGLS